MASEEKKETEVKAPGVVAKTTNKALKYAIGATLALPVATSYLGAKIGRGIKSTALGLVLGYGVGVGAVHGTASYVELLKQDATIQKPARGVVVRNAYTRTQIPEPELPKEVMDTVNWSSDLFLNTDIYFNLFGEYEQETTEVRVTAKDGDNTIVCTGKAPGYNNIRDLEWEVRLDPLVNTAIDFENDSIDVLLGGVEVTGEGRELYVSKCEQKLNLATLN